MSNSKKKKIFWLVLILLIIGAVLLSYLRIFVFKDYFLVKEVFCDSETESCFMYSPEELCVDSENLNCIEETEQEYYKIIHKKAANVEVCESDLLEESEECPELSCEEGELESECYYEYNEE